MNVQAGGVRETWIQVPVPQHLASPSLSSILCAVRMTAVSPYRLLCGKGPAQHPTLQEGPPPGRTQPGTPRARPNLDVRL